MAILNWGKKKKIEEERKKRIAELIAERDSLKKDKEDFVNTKSKVNGLMSSLEECIKSLDMTYEKICLGISCGDSSITSSIDKIATYKQNLTKECTNLSEILNELSTEIANLDTSISKLNSEIGSE